jgi:hypothetical protein
MPLHVSFIYIRQDYIYTIQRTLVTYGRPTHLIGAVFAEADADLAVDDFGVIGSPLFPCFE